MNRRRFLKQAGLWVPAALAFPAIVRAQRSPFSDPARVAAMMRRKAVSGSFSPSDISGLTLWLKADAGAFSDAGTTPAVNTDPVEQWNDQSGSGNNASQATLASRPIYSTNVKNSLPVIQFSYTSNYFMDMGSIDLFNGGIFSFFFAGAPGKYSGDAHYIYRQAARYKLFSDPVLKLQKESGDFETIAGSADLTDVWCCLTVIRSGANSGDTKMYKNGTQDDNATAIPAATGANTSTVSGAAAACFTGAFGELIFYNSALSATNQGKVENYLKTKWAL